MEDIITTDEERECLKKIKTLKELIFINCKYHCKLENESFNIAKQYASWRDLLKAAKQEGKEKSKCESFKEEFTDSYYRPLHQKIKRLQTIFNTDKKIEVEKHEEALFWYDIILRVQAKPKIWNNIIYTVNYNQIGFLRTYKKMRSLAAKKDFLDETYYFISNYTNLISLSKNNNLAKEYYDNIIKTTNYEILELIMFFDKINIKATIKDLRILSVYDRLNDKSYVEQSHEYKNYLSRIVEEITQAVEKVNQEFNHLNTFFSIKEAFKKAPPVVIQKDINLEELSDSPDLQIKNFLVEKLKEIDYKYYELLNANNFDDIIINDPLGFTEAEKQKRFIKIRDDLMKAIGESPKLLEYLYDHPFLMLSLGIVL